MEGPLAATSHNSIGPCRESGHVIEAGQTAQNVDPSFLDDVFCALAITEYAPRVAKQLRLPTRDQASQCGAIARDGSSH